MNAINPTQRTYKTLDDAYRFFNERLFNGKLPALPHHHAAEQEGLRLLRRWLLRSVDGKEVTDEIALNPSHFRSRTTEQSLSTLVHEMAHCSSTISASRAAPATTTRNGHG